MGAPIELKGTILVRSMTAAEWAAANPVLERGEPGRETDTGKIKYGDGKNTWKSLQYSNNGADHSCRYLTSATKDITLQESDEVVAVEGAKNITLPNGKNGKTLYIYKQDDTATVLKAAGTEKIQYGAAVVQSHTLTAAGLALLFFEATQKKWLLAMNPIPLRY